ncbi:MAG: hypothetical protein AAFU65_12690 [Pseudomonadota bacterium]
MNSVNITEVSVPTAQSALNGTLFTVSDEPSVAVVLNGATGVPRRFYRSFARWLARERNAACLIYDYQDADAPKAVMRRSRVTMQSWALDDQPAAQRYLRALYPEVPFWVMGHSLGGIALSLHDAPERLDGVITVASGMAHVSDHPWPFQAVARLFWFGLGPLATRLMGYTPGAALGLGADLPAGVYWNWRRWCVSPDFYQSELGDTLPAYRPLPPEVNCTMFAFDDDVFIPPAPALRLARFYNRSGDHLTVLSPANFGVDAIGHVGAFREKNQSVWPALAEPIPRYH